KNRSVFVQNKKKIVKSLLLSQNYPNPFNPKTTIEYILTEPSNVLIRIYDGLGKELLTLINTYQTSGKHFVKWYGKDRKGNEVSSGVYIYRIDTGKFSDSKIMLLIK
ncbi:MAG: T9SS type A sorting domain-containing protein, partial [Ignavibacteriaceae bacterium]